MSRLTLPVPRGVELHRAVASYGYFVLAPNRWEPASQTLMRVLKTQNREPFTVQVRQRSTAPHPLIIETSQTLSRDEQARVKAAISRMLRLDEDFSLWHQVWPKDAKRRRFDRMFRSPSLWEDMVKTITGCNVAWRNTMTMNRRLCDCFGEGGFPSPQQIASVSAETVQGKARVGYRAPWIVDLAHQFCDGSFDPAWYESPDRTSDELFKSLKKLKGFGAYAAANVCMLLGHYDRLAIDTETYRHFEQVYGQPRGDNPTAQHATIQAHYQQYEPYAFLAYWFELWHVYEQQRGPAWTWENDQPWTVLP